MRILALFWVSLFLSFISHFTSYRSYLFLSSRARKMSELDALGGEKRLFDLPPDERPLKRDFVTLQPPSSNLKVVDDIRILQFNLLADGLSGLREDLGAFSRARKSFMVWQSRKRRLLFEILQYAPDIITLQECDHYYDYFMPELAQYGYLGVFAPKPASASLEVSENSDGCAVFYKTTKLEILSQEVITYALSPLAVSLDQTGDTSPLPQNQVALLLLFQLLPKNDQPCLLLGTTHLKASKSAQGERCRALELQQLLEAMDRGESMLAQLSPPKHAVLVMTGDFNACPNAISPLGGFPSEAYPLVKASPRRWRSAYNDDLREYYGGEGLEGEDKLTWTTWKARRKGSGGEQEVRHCIDYIFYAPPPLPPASNPFGVRAKGVLRGFGEGEVAEELFPSPSYPSDHVSLAADLQIVQRTSPDP